MVNNLSKLTYEIIHPTNNIYCILISLYRCLQTYLYIYTYLQIYLYLYISVSSRLFSGNHHCFNELFYLKISSDLLRQWWSIILLFYFYLVFQYIFLNFNFSFFIYRSCLLARHNVFLSSISLFHGNASQWGLRNHTAIECLQQWSWPTSVVTPCAESSRDRAEQGAGSEVMWVLDCEYMATPRLISGVCMWHVFIHIAIFILPRIYQIKGQLRRQSS